MVMDFNWIQVLHDQVQKQGKIVFSTFKTQNKVRDKLRVH